MKYLDHIRKHGISLQKLNYVMLALAILISIVLFIAMYRTNVMYQNTHKITENLISWRQSSYELQIASDYLTEEMRCFVVTGKKECLGNYFKEAKVSKRRDHALEDLKAHHEDSVAFHDLNNAMEQSLELMKREYYAARLAADAYGYDISSYPEEIRGISLEARDLNLSKEKKKELAEHYMFGEEYQSQKHTISKHMQNCLDSLEDEMKAGQLEISEKLRHQVWIEHILTILLIVVMLGIVMLTSFMIIVPLRKCVNLIRDERDIPLEGAYEIRFLAKTYNLMYHTNLQNREKLTYEATHDKLTNLYNRRGYDFLLSNVDLETSALLLFDMDHFKQINDKYGHAIGDKAIIRVSESMFGSFRNQDYVCRIGGDEFAVIMVHSDPSLKELIERKINKINENLKENLGDGVPPLSVSVGVAFGDDGVTADTLFKMADNSLYEAKNHGRNKVCFHNTDA